MARIASRFGRVEPRRRARGYLLGLLSPLAGKNSWTIAEAAGDATPDGMQRLLNNFQWDADTVRDDLRDYVTEHLGEPDGVLIVDETGFLDAGITGSRSPPPAASANGYAAEGSPPRKPRSRRGTRRSPSRARGFSHRPGLWRSG
jgi:hypothetical protein